MAKPIVTSICDVDLYKFTVQQIIFNRFANIPAEYEFTCRNKDSVDLLKYVPEYELREQLYVHLAGLKLTEQEYEYLKAKEWISETYLEYLANFQLHPNRQLEIARDEENRTYRIRVKAPWAVAMMYEIFVLEIVNEIFEKNYTGNDFVGVWQRGNANLDAKIAKLKDYNSECEREGYEVPKIMEFGTRRRYSRMWQTRVLERLLAELPNNIVGTSNVSLAINYQIAPLGTFGHEFPMGMQGIYPVQHSQRQAFKVWLTEYRGLWGSALTDTLGDEKFFKDFSFELAKGFDGVRHDSGDPFVFGERIIKMYEKYGIDPKTKRLVFSDGLDIETVIALHRVFRGRIQVVFGIGTNLTNDLGNPVLHIVMKITKCNGQDVCKLSANPAKASCKNPLYLEYTRMAIEQY